MPWYEPCARFGYTKFLSNPQLRSDQWVVNDNYLQSLLEAYRRGYINAGGPDYEDSDDVLLDKLAENCISSTSAAATLGAADARADKAAGQDAHPQSFAPGGAIPTTPSTGQAEHMAVVYATTNPQGQPPANPVMPPPSTIGFGNPSAAARDGAGSPMGSFTGSAPESGGLFGIPWWLIAVAAVGGYLLLKKK